jgi:hypothetical protein
VEHAIVAHGIPLASNQIAQERTPDQGPFTLFRQDPIETRIDALTKLRSVMAVIEDRLRHTQTTKQEYIRGFRKGARDYYNTTDFTDDLPTKRTERRRRTTESIYKSNFYTDPANWKPTDFEDEGELVAIYIDYAFGNKLDFGDNYLSKNKRKKLTQTVLDVVTLKDKIDSPFKKLTTDIRQVNVEGDYTHRRDQMFLSFDKLIGGTK